MAEDYVSRDQHRADMAELRGELKEEIAGLRQNMTTMRGELKEEIAGVRQEIIALTKMMEANQQTMLLRFEQADQRHSDLLAMLSQRFDQAEQQRQEDRQEINQRFAQHETRLGSLENWIRTTFVTVAVVVAGVAAQLFYTLMRFGLKPPPGAGGP